jgi:hypothetical protein
MPQAHRLLFGATQKCKVRPLPKFEDDAETAVPVRLHIGPECVASERVGYGLLPASMPTGIRALGARGFSLAGCWL